jgi:hypothetical protein
MDVYWKDMGRVIQAWLAFGVEALHVTPLPRMKEANVTEMYWEEVH